jgi:hypothetical protein
LSPQEAQIKKLIESRKRTPAPVTTSCSVQTEAGLADLGDNTGDASNSVGGNEERFIGVKSFMFSVLVVM